MSAHTTTHDGRLVYPAGTELPGWARGWTQCDNRGGGYAVWLADDDQPRSRADLQAIEKQAAQLRTRAQCEAALRELGLLPHGSCRDMRVSYVNRAYADLWPLRQVAS